ncbi:hypothetical protein [Hamadaea tsunoensis]|uniref:hypothetical protein n=1 Tax=Hamadaea tsunoensis TaxID=53368 RepID=UPI0004105D62|nr:hypothetical protein [Hamadaea tsunoensis]
MTIGGYCRLAGLVVGTGLAFAMTRTYLFDLAPVALAAAVAAGLLAGEAVTPRPARARGVASLRPRRLGDYLSGRTVLVVVLLGAGVLGLGLLRLPHHPGHEIDYFGVASPVSLVTTKATLGVVALLAGLTVWLVARSAQTGATEIERAEDEAWRQAAVRRIANCCAAVFALVFTALGFWYADSELDWRGGGSPTMGVALSLLSAAGLVLFAYYAATLIAVAAEPATPARPESLTTVDATVR